MKPWEHFQRPDDDDLTCAVEDNKAAMRQVQSMMDSHTSLNGRRSKDDGDCGTEPAREPDANPGHVPVQYGRVGLLTRLLALVGIRKTEI